jgi:aspartyl-tRNA synthetase
MKKQINLCNLHRYVGQVVTINGFVDTIRDQKKMQFLILRNCTGKIQVVHVKSDEDFLTFTISSLTAESTVSIIGTVIEAPHVKLGGIEIQLESLVISSLAENPLPIAFDSVLEKQIDWRQISLRTEKNYLIFKVQTTMEEAMRDFWKQNDFLEIHSPKLMGTASESGAELFELDYFNDIKAYLAQSPQFYKQMAMASGFDRIFEIGPVFRANPSFTSRHDTEFTSVDMEIAWIDSHEDVMNLEEDLIAYILTQVKNLHGIKIKELFGVDVVVPKTPFPRISLLDARKVLESRGHIIDHKEDLDPEGERQLCSYVHDKYGHEFVFVTDYPVEVRAFYHMRYEDNPSLTKSFDLLWKGLEITTGAQREHRLDKLMAQATSKGFSHEPLQNYFNFFRYGCPPHGGCGIGLTRLLMILFNIKNVREVTYIYRGPNRLTP